MARREEGALAYVGTDATSPQEFKDIFGLDKGSLVLIYGDPGTPGSYTAAGFGLLVPDYPTQEELEELKEQHGYELLPD